MVKIDTQVSEKILTAAITAVGIEAPAKYACYLYRGDEIIAKSGYQKENEFFFPLESAGIYHVRGLSAGRRQAGAAMKDRRQTGNRCLFSLGFQLSTKSF